MVHEHESTWEVWLGNIQGDIAVARIGLGWSGPHEFRGGNGSVIERDDAWDERRLSAVMAEQRLRRALASTSGGKRVGEASHRHRGRAIDTASTAWRMLRTRSGQPERGSSAPRSGDRRGGGTSNRHCDPRSTPSTRRAAGYARVTTR
jgi:hypothetical protein